MPVFTRRALQRCINDSVNYASQSTIRAWVRALNSSQEPNYTSKEWEIIVLNAFSKVGDVGHPKETSKQATLDCHFTSFDGSLTFAADVVAVSDRGLHRQNPIHDLQKQIDKRYKDAQLPKGGLRFRVEEAPNPRTLGHKRQLLLPE